MVTPTLPLSGLRVVTTLPPATWFGGVDYAFAMDMAAELRSLGADLLPIDVAGFVDRNPGHVRDAIQAIQSFHPDLVMSLPNAGYALVCNTAEGENIFRDILELPTILIWDHGLHQFSRLILGSDGTSPRGCLERLRVGLGNPHFIHYSPDRGHTAALDRLGILSAAKVRQFVHFAFPVYARCGGQPFDGAIGSRLAFAGNLYVEGSRNLPSRNHPVLAGIEARMAARKRAEITCSCWDLLMDEIQRCEESIRDGLDLDPDRAPFWSFVNDAVQVVGTTESRLTVLTGLRREFDFFGNFMEPAMAGPLFEQYGIRVRRNLDCISELPLLYQNSELIVDVINAGYISGISPKVPSCLASGGLIVFDYKQDFREALGEAADLVMFRNLDEMRSLIDGYLGNPRKRRAVALELQQRVLREFTFDAFCRRVLVEESAWHC